MLNVNPGRRGLRLACPGLSSAGLGLARAGSLGLIGLWLCQMELPFLPMVSPDVVCRYRDEQTFRRFPSGSSQPFELAVRRPWRLRFVARSARRSHCLPTGKSVEAGVWRKAFSSDPAGGGIFMSRSTRLQAATKRSPARRAGSPQRQRWLNRCRAGPRAGSVCRSHPPGGAVP